MQKATFTPDIMSLLRNVVGDKTTKNLQRVKHSVNVDFGLGLWSGRACEGDMPLLWRVDHRRQQQRTPNLQGGENHVSVWEAACAELQIRSERLHEVAVRRR